MKKWAVASMLSLILMATESYALDFTESYLNTSVGVGQLYGGAKVGLNNEYIINEYISGQLGVGYTNDTNLGAVVGISGYPIKNNQYTFSPRLTALYGRVGKVSYSDGSHKNGYGYALGGGVEYPVAASKKWIVNLDLFYTTITNPVKSNGESVFSVGVGYSFK